MVICLGGLIDGDMLIRAQMWFGGKTPISGNAVISEIPPQHRLSASNPGFRGNAFVPEGPPFPPPFSTWPTAPGAGPAVHAHAEEIHHRALFHRHAQLFASDVVVTDRATGKRTEATIKVNEPLVVDGVAIYQSSFEDGGSHLKFVGYPMQGSSDKTFAFTGSVGGNARWPAPVPRRTRMA